MATTDALRLPFPVKMSTPMMANLALRFMVEMAAYAALGYWGVSTTSPFIARVALATLAPLGAVALWSALLAPKARWRRNDPVAIALELAVFAGAAVALATSGPVRLSLVFIVIAVTNTLLVRRFDPRFPTAATGSEPAPTVIPGSE